MKPLIEPAIPADYIEIVEVWEASVRATHNFLTEETIQYFKPLILRDYLKAVNLFCVRNDQKQIVGFLGVADGNIEMLFLHPSIFGNGVGRMLTEYAIKELRATKVNVNEQNEQAVGFYHRLGFKTKSRSPLDGLGKPFPILHLEL